MRNDTTFDLSAKIFKTLDLFLIIFIRSDSPFEIIFENFYFSDINLIQSSLIISNLSNYKRPILILISNFKTEENI